MELSGVSLRSASGLLLIHLGAGGALLSIFWDVVYRGRALDLGAVGPFKLAGTGAGLVIMILGLWLRFVEPKRSLEAPGGAPDEGVPEAIPVVEATPVEEQGAPDSEATREGRAREGRPPEPSAPGKTDERSRGST